MRYRVTYHHTYGAAVRQVSCERTADSPHQILNELDKARRKGRVIRITGDPAASAGIAARSIVNVEIQQQETPDAHA